MPMKIEFVFLTAGCQVLKIGLFDGRWLKSFQINDRLKLEIDVKTNLLIDGVEIECVLLKHGPPAAMQVEFERYQEIYGAFAQQFENPVSGTPPTGAKWTLSQGGTPTPRLATASPRVLVRAPLFSLCERVIAINIKHFLSKKSIKDKHCNFLREI